MVEGKRYFMHDLDAGGGTGGGEGDNPAGAGGDDGQGGSGSQQNNQSLGFRAALKEEYRDNEILSGMGNINHMYEALVERQGKLDGLKGRTIPGEGATKEDWDVYRKAMGVPDDKTGYKFEYPEGMDKNVLDGMADWMRDVAFEEGFPSGVAGKVFSRWSTDLIANTKADHEAAVTKKQAALLDMAKEHGKDWDTNLASTKNFAKSLFDEDGYAILEQMNLLDNPVILKKLMGLKGRISEDSLPKSAGVTGSSTGERNATSRAASLFPETKPGDYGR